MVVYVVETKAVETWDSRFYETAALGQLEKQQTRFCTYFTHSGSKLNEWRDLNTLIYFYELTLVEGILHQMAGGGNQSKINKFEHLEAKHIAYSLYFDIAY